jgi:hypothetical protein
VKVNDIPSHGHLVFQSITDLQANNESILWFLVTLLGTCHLNRGVQKGYTDQAAREACGREPESTFTQVPCKCAVRSSSCAILECNVRA